ncbi:MAG TPA: carboxypeptidase-like regulatory domain-containing protein [Methylomirabilota bacterium]|nr:carboxypeptidase-like regulatory domain-containing protein [Methylomirabilota bacterium]
MFTLLSAEIFESAHAQGKVSGWIVNAGSGVPVEMAPVLLHSRPASADPVHELRSDAFGFFTMTNITAGDYTLRVEHPAYNPYATNITIAANDTTNLSIKLQPIDGKTHFDIYFNVYCEKTSAELVGATVNVEYWEPDGDLSGAADRVFPPLSAGAGGSVTLLGASDGFYKFTVSKVGWQPNTYTPSSPGMIVVGDKVRLNRAHFATAYLRPILTPLVVTVTGYDPVQDKPNMPLKGITVSITGMSLPDPTPRPAIFGPWPPLELVPPVSALSSEAGTFTFRGLAPIRWLVTVEKLGYKSKEILVEPAANGTLTMPPVQMELEPTKVRAVVSSMYLTNAAVLGATVKLQGIRASGTEGINRELKAATATNNSAFALFENLLPGRYWMHVQHETTISGLPSRSGQIIGPSAFSVRYFPKETYAQVFVGQTEELEVEIEPVPARIRGRLFATDELAKVDTEIFNPEPNRVFHLIAQNGINLVEHKLIRLLPEDRRKTITDSDESGHYTVLVPPGIFGVQIPTMANYTGHNIEFGDLTAGQPPFVGPWPYPDIWPHATIEGGHHGAGLRMDSAHEYQLDLFMHRQYINACGFVRVTGQPFRDLVLSMKSDGTEVQSVPYNHLYDVGAEVVATGPMTVRAPVRQDTGFILKDLKPGTYTVTLNHPNYTTLPATLTIAPWDPPGILPTTPPRAPGYYFPGITHSISELRIDADWKIKGNIEIPSLNWVAGDPPGYFQGQTKNPAYFRDDTLPGRLFTYNGGGPAGNFVVWQRFGDGWYTGASGSDLLAYDGGPRDNTPPNGAPSDIPTYSLDLHAYSVADESIEIPGVVVQFPKSVRTSGGIVPHDDSPNPRGATVDGWFYVRSTREVVNMANRLVRLKVFMRKAMAASGRVTSGGFPVGKAAVVLRSRYGTPLSQTMTDAQGNYRFTQLEPQPVYVDIAKRGFVPARKRLESGPISNPDISSPAGDIEMAQVPAPNITSFTMNRFGLFLPSVSKSGDSSILNEEGRGVDLGLDVDNARNSLTVTWKASAQATNKIQVSLPGYVNPDETQKPPEQFEVTDKVTEIWIVDRRAFTNAFVNDLTQRAFDAVNPPARLTYPNALEWLAEIASGQRGGQPYYVIHQQMNTTGATNTGTFTNSFKLWELPSGVFSPRIIAITEAGGVAVKDYELPSGDWSHLQGMNLPDWISGLLDIIGTMAIAPRGEGGIHGHNTYKVNGESKNGWLKIGSVSPLAEARIGLVPLDAKPEDNTTLTYKYVLGVEFPMSESSSNSKQMSFWPSSFGYKISGLALEFEVVGKDKQVALGVVRQNSFAPDEEQQDKDFAPVAAGPDPTVKVDANMKHTFKFGATQTVDNDWLGNNTLASYSYLVEAQGGVDVVVKANLSRVARTLPNVGPFLAGLDASGAMTLYGIFETSMGAKVKLERVTQLPKPGTGGTQTRGDGPSAFDLLGQSTNINTAEFKMYLRIAAGLQVAIAKGLVEGTILGQIGAPRNAADSDGVFFTVDPINRAPLIQQIDGALSVVGRVAVNLWTLKLQKQFQWDGLVFSIDRRNSTVAAQGLRALADGNPPFDLVPINITYTVFDPANATRFAFSGTGSKRIENFYPGGAFALATGSKPLLVFTGTDPATGQMTVMVSLEKDGQWSSPMQITSAGGVISVTAAQLLSGGWMVVWSEIAPGEMRSAFPPTSLKYSTSDAAGNAWTAPATITAQAAAMYDLELSAAGQKLLLGWMATTDAPTAGTASLHSATWDGETWSGATALLEGRNIERYELRGHTSGAGLAAAVDAGGDLTVARWNGSEWSAAGVVATNTLDSFALAFRSDGGAVLALTDTNNWITLSALGLPGLQTASLGVAATNAFADELVLTPIQDKTRSLFLLAWASGAEGNSLSYLFTDQNGAPLMAVAEVSAGTPGIYKNLSARSLGDGRAAISMQLSTATNSSVHEFIVGLPAPSDCDGDGITDATEIAAGTAHDCNGNGVPDSCDLATGTLMDRNQNGIPDTCEPAIVDDCNGNGISDAHELELGIGDFDGNGKLDDCESLIQVKSISIQTTVTKRYFRAVNLRVRSWTTQVVELEFEGALEQADQIIGPWQPAQ